MNPGCVACVTVRAPSPILKSVTFNYGNLLPQTVISKLSVHSDAFEYAIKLEPALLFYDGNFLSDGCK